MKDSDPTRRPAPEPPSRRNALLAVLVVVVLIGTVFLVMRQLHHDAAIQDCIASGRTNCAPINPSR